MRDALLAILADPVDRQPLLLTGSQRDPEGDVLSGHLEGAAGRRYPITSAIPRFVLTEDANQKQTQQSFGFKWQQRHTYDSPAVLASSREWLVSRYGFVDVDEMRRYMASRPRVLDAGCGSGFSASLWLTAEWGGAMWVGVDISDAIDVARSRLGAVPDTHYVQGDLLQLPFADGTFDVVFSEGVLHHTPSTADAFRSLVRLLTPGGELMAYVYRRKAPVREFTDDYIRGIVSALEPQDAWAALRPLTALGRALSSLKAEVDVPQDIPYLGIKAGRHDVQRLMYWHFAKMFWNDAFSFEENNHINFDWYHPRYAHRHTESELRSWCDETGLTMTHLDAQESGYTIRAVKR
jgi:arsenite methyltransferase